MGVGRYNLLGKVKQRNIVISQFSIDLCQPLVARGEVVGSGHCPVHDPYPQYKLHSHSVLSSLFVACMYDSDDRETSAASQKQILFASEVLSVRLSLCMRKISLFLEEKLAVQQNHCPLPHG